MTFGGGQAPSAGKDGNDDDDEYEELTPEAIQAAEWVNKEIGKVIDEIKRLGIKNGKGQHEVKFGPFFDELGNVFEALSGTLRTAKKYKVVDFPGETLFQGRDDDVPITLLKEKFEGVEIKRRKKSQLKAAPKGARSFSVNSQQHQQAKCHACGKTVYQMEYVGASDKAFHKTCFKCTECQRPLKQNDYCVAPDGKFYCTPHYTQLAKGATNLDTLTLQNNFGN